MTITFKNNNDVLIYAFKKIIAYTRNNQYIFVAECVWWIASIIGLQEGLVTHINNLRIRLEAYRKPSSTYSDTGNIHPDRVRQLQENQRGSESQGWSLPESERTSTSEDNLQDQVLWHCEEY